METVEQIEEQIKARNYEISEATRSARIKNQAELDKLHKAKLRLLAEKNKQSSEYLKQLQPIINSIVEIAMRINHGGRHTLFVDYSGHVKWLKISGYDGEWAAHKDRTHDWSVWLTMETEEEFKGKKEILLEIKRDLEDLEESTNE